MIANQSFVNKESGVRLDAAILLHFPASTRAFVKEAVNAGEITVNGRKASKGLKLRGGETIAVGRLAEAADNTVLPSGTVPGPFSKTTRCSRSTSPPAFPFSRFPTTRPARS